MIHLNVPIKYILPPVAGRALAMDRTVQELALVGVVALAKDKTALALGLLEEGPEREL